MDRILELRAVKALALREGDRFTVVAGPGALDVVTFTIDGNVACAGFALAWGSFGGELAGSGNRRLSGYGCEARGKSLDRARVKQALDSLEVDDWAAGTDLHDTHAGRCPGERPQACYRNAERALAACATISAARTDTLRTVAE